MKCLKCRRSKLFGGKTAFGGKQSTEVAGQGRDVFFPLVQTRYLDHDHAQSVVQVFSEATFGHFFFQVFVGSGQYPHVHRDGLVCPHRGDGVFLQGAQNLGLRGQAHVPNLVQEERAFVGQFKLALAVFNGGREGAFGVAFMEQVDKGCVIDAATHDAKTREDWWYPSYVEDVCPGLPDWEALNACAEMFATPDSGGKGRFLGGPVDWLKGDQERVEGLEMDFIVENAGTAGALWAALDAASANQDPVVIFNWTPNFTDAEGFDFIKFPAYTDGCRKADGGEDRKSTRLNSSHRSLSRMPSSA